MGVKCSLLGHDYGTAEVERERAEEGDEVVRTAKRVERCRNCDHERTVSENKEVTALSAAAGVTREPDGTVVATPETPDETTDSGSVTVEQGDPTDERTAANGGISRERIEDTENALDPSPAEDADESPESADRSTNESEIGRTVEIDEIRDTEPQRHTRPSRAPGEWPAEPDDPATTGGASSGLDTFGSLSESSGSWPAESDSAANPRAGTPESGTAVRRPAQGGESGGTAVTDRTGGRPASTFACRTCGFVAGVADSPLRAGDICPECRRGYLAWETRKG